MIATSDQFEIRFRSTPNLIRQHDIYTDFPAFEEAEERSGSVVSIVCFVLMLATGAVYLLEYYDLLPGRATISFAAGAGFAAIVAAIGCMTVMRGTLQQLIQADEARRQTLLDCPESTVTFGPDGVIERTERGETSFVRSGISEIREFGGGAVLMLGAGSAIFVPDAYLPDGIDRAEAMRRFRKWKGPW